MKALSDVTKKKNTQKLFWARSRWYNSPVQPPKAASSILCNGEAAQKQEEMNHSNQAASSMSAPSNVRSWNHTTVESLR